MKTENSIRVFTSLTDALELKQGEVISLIGGGGKTTLMFALAAEIVSVGSRVITTTTTKIMEPEKTESPYSIVSKNEEEMIRSLNQHIEKKRHITLGSEKLSTGQFKGITPQMVERLAGLQMVSCIIVEADGAAGRPLKAPNATEPVIPANTSLVIPVIGVEAIGVRLGSEYVFRQEIVADLLKVSAEEILSARLIAALLTHPQGIIKGTPQQSRIIPFINKVDLDGNLVRAMELAEEILKTGHPLIKRVIIGQANNNSSLLTGIISG